MHRSRRVLGLATALVGFFAAVPAANAVSAGVVVAEVYGGGGNSGATLTNDFVELGNAGAAAADVTGWSVQYLPAAPSAASVWQVTPLTGTVAAGGRYLIQEAQGAGGSVPLPTPDATGTIAMAATAGTVAVVNTTTPLVCRTAADCAADTRIIDLVGYGTRRRPRDGACTGHQQHHVRRPVDAHGHRQQRRRLHGRDAEPAEQPGVSHRRSRRWSGSTTSRETGISPRWRTQRSERRAWSPRSVPSARPGASGCRIRSLTPWRPRARASSSAPGPRRRPCSPAMP